MTDITFTRTGKKKLNPQTYAKAIKSMVRNTTLKADALCKEEAPAGPTGNLRGGHDTDIKDYTGNVTNKEPYALWIIWGGRDGKTYSEGNIYYYNKKPFTSKGVPNNYPQRVTKFLATEKYPSRFLEEALEKEGVL